MPGTPKFSHEMPEKWQKRHPALEKEPPKGADPQRPNAELLLWAYGHSLFPMADPDSRKGRIDWFSPDPRAIFPLEPLDAIHIPKNLSRLVRQETFEIRCDSQFAKVMRECAGPRSDDNRSWINDQLIQAYVQLFEMGHAHSIEAWRDGLLVGGLYGVQIGGAFFGESMFSRPSIGGGNSSKVCLVHLLRWLRERGFGLLDTQFSNDHLQQFGIVEIPAEEYFALLQAAIRLPVTWGRFRAC